MKRVHTARLLMVVGALALTGCGTSGDDASTSSTNFAGMTIELIVPFDPGGGYDQYARQLAPKLEAELEAEIVVVNEPGAGGLLATNQLTNAEPDGSSIAIFNMPGHIGAALAEADGVNYQPEEFSYIGQISSEPDVLIAKEGGEYETFDDLAQAAEAEQLKLSSTGPGANDYMDAVVLDSVLGIENDIVAGYNSGDDAALAVFKDDVDGFSRSLYSQLPLIDDGDAQPLLTVGSERPDLDQLKDVPTILDIAKTDEQGQLLDFHTRLVESGRAFAAPPGMEPERLEELRKAFEEVVTDPAFAKASEKKGRPITFASGEQVAEEVAELADAPSDYVSLVKEGFDAEG